MLDFLWLGLFHYFSLFSTSFYPFCLIISHNFSYLGPVFCVRVCVVCALPCVCVVCLLLLACVRVWVCVCVLPSRCCVRVRPFGCVCVWACVRCRLLVVRRVRGEFARSFRCWEAVSPPPTAVVCSCSHLADFTHVCAAGKKLARFSRSVYVRRIARCFLNAVAGVPHLCGSPIGLSYFLWGLSCISPLRLFNNHKISTPFPTPKILQKIPKKLHFSPIFLLFFFFFHFSLAFSTPFHSPFGVSRFKLQKTIKNSKRSLFFDFFLFFHFFFLSFSRWPHFYFWG